jgi:hypothetical protein
VDDKKNGELEPFGMVRAGSEAHNIICIGLRLRRHQESQPVGGEWRRRINRDVDFNQREHPAGNSTQRRVL